MRAALIVITQPNGKLKPVFFEQASEGKKAFNDLSKDTVEALFWELSRPKRRFKKTSKPTGIEVVPFFKKEAEPKKEKSSKPKKSKPKK